MNNLQHRNLLHVQVLHREWVSTLLHSSDDRINARGASKKTDLHSNINFWCILYLPSVVLFTIVYQLSIVYSLTIKFLTPPCGFGLGCSSLFVSFACEKKKKKKKWDSRLCESINPSLNNRYFSVLRTAGKKNIAVANKGKREMSVPEEKELLNWEWINLCLELNVKRCDWRLAADNE